MSTNTNQGMLTRAQLDKLLSAHLDTGNEHGLRMLLKTTQDRAADMARLPWPALAASWLDTADTVRQVITVVKGD